MELKVCFLWSYHASDQLVKFYKLLYFSTSSRPLTSFFLRILETEALCFSGLCQFSYCHPNTFGKLYCFKLKGSHHPLKKLTMIYMTVEYLYGRSIPGYSKQKPTRSDDKESDRLSYSRVGIFIMKRKTFHWCVSVGF